MGRRKIPGVSSPIGSDILSRFWAGEEELKWARDNVLVALLCSLGPWPELSAVIGAAPERPKMAYSGACNSPYVRRVFVCLVPGLEAGCHTFWNWIAKR